MNRSTLAVTVFENQYDRSTATLFIHGFMGSARDWSEIAAGLGGFCMGVDLPGHGDSIGLKKSDYFFARTVDLIIESLDAFRLRAVNVVGYSMGGRLALALACTHPDRVSHLILESASPGLKTAKERSDRINLDRDRSREILLDFSAFLKMWYSLPLFSTFAAAPERRERIIRNRSRNRPEEIARALEGLGTGSQPSYWEALESMKVSTTAVVGSEDDQFVRIADDMASRTDRIERVIIPGAGHNVHLDCVKAYLQAVKSTLK